MPAQTEKRLCLAAVAASASGTVIALLLVSAGCTPERTLNSASNTSCSGGVSSSLRNTKRSLLMVFLDPPMGYRSHFSGLE